MKVSPKRVYNGSGPRTKLCARRFEQEAVMVGTRSFTRVVALSFALASLLYLPAHAEQPDGRPIGLGLWLGGSMPIGAAATLVDPGVAARFAAEYRFVFAPLYAGLHAGYSRATLGELGTLETYSAAGTVGVRIPVGDRLSAIASGFVGYGFSTLSVGESAGAGGSIGYGGAGGVHFRLSPLVSIGATVGYAAHANTYQGVHASVGTILSFPMPGFTPREPRPTIVPLAAGESPVKIDPIELDTIFPVFYRYYDTNPVGRATLRNDGGTAATSVTVRLYMPRYMDVAKTQAVPTTIEPGQQVSIDLYALLTDEVLRVTEGTKAAVSIEVEYTTRGSTQRFAIDRTIDIADRNAMTWDDDRKAASFVTAKDPVVLTFGRNVASVVRAAGFDSINLNLRTAIAMTEALASYGLNYVIDPTSPYAELSGQSHVVDFLQFPRQTLEYRAGDCDDLSILYAALLESVGIPAAFVTVPGHIFTAFSTGMTRHEAQAFFSRIDELVIHDDIAWIPVEVTILNDGFLQAWQSGARQWRENAVRGQAGFYPIAQAWELYPSVGLPDAPPHIAIPAPAVIDGAYRAQLTRFVDREIFPQVSRLQSQIASSNNNPRHINRLGVLYARYGLSDRARREFERAAMGSPPYAPALLNLGNLHFLSREVDQALGYYERAHAVDPDNTVILLAVARANHELENYGHVARTYERLKQLDPDLADRFAYLDFRGEEARRASQASEMATLVIWGEE
ncbi:MAG: hypothetical protein EA382_13330 [Spirochaetaceae bacterium]|nr:MAG: hypothetical protein EA382_13330 [Spirochaetaceae bacterium]